MPKVMLFVKLRPTSYASPSLTDTKTSPNVPRQGVGRVPLVAGHNVQVGAVHSGKSCPFAQGLGVSLLQANIEKAIIAIMAIIPINLIVFFIEKPPFFACFFVEVFRKLKFPKNL